MSDTNVWLQLEGFSFPTPIVGIDPGKNYGICTITEDNLHIKGGVLGGKFPTECGVEAYYYARWNIYPNAVVYLENAAFGSVGKLTGLERVRSGFLYGAVSLQITPVLVAPNSARKEVLGSAKLTMKNLFNINPNSADAVGLALYGVSKEIGKEEMLRLYDYIMSKIGKGATD